MFLVAYKRESQKQIDLSCIQTHFLVFKRQELNNGNTGNGFNTVTEE